MISEEQINKNKLEYLTLLSKLNIDLTALSRFLDNIDYFNQPATSQAYKAYKGGLCEYALALYSELNALSHAYFQDTYSEEDIIKVALFRDLYRAMMYEPVTKNVFNGKTQTWETVNGYRTKEDRPSFGDLSFSSYMLAQHFLTFTDEQIMAIMHSRPLENFTKDIHDILTSYPLVTLTRMADLATNYLEEA